MITHWTCQVFQQVFGVAPYSLRLMYDVCHNIAKREKHDIEGKERWVCVHRKGATRASPPPIRTCPKPTARQDSRC